MLDIKWIRRFPQSLDAALAVRGLPPAAPGLLTLDGEYTALLGTCEALKAERNALARRIAATKQTGEDPASLMERGGQIREDISRQEEQMGVLKKQLDDALVLLPNLPGDDVPPGKDASSNPEVKRWGTPPVWSFPPRTHDVLGEALGMDFETAARMSGSRFVLLKGDLARLERALAMFMLDIHTEVFGYQEVSVPYLVRDEAVYGVGQLPKFREDLFGTTDGRWLISTAEVPLTATIQDQIFSEPQLPQRYVAYTPCFRSEAGAAGRDTHGMIRLHQFSKVELVHVTSPEQAAQEHAFLLNAAEEILRRLGLAYRVVLLCGGDMGATARKTYDIEVWLPGQQAYREISSCSWCGDYQSRRLNGRLRAADGTLEFVHTLNGSALAVGRTLVAVLETYQQEDGTLLIPEALQPYMKGQTYLGRS